LTSAQHPLLKAAAWAARLLPAPIKRWFYKIPFLARIARRALNMAVPEGISEVTIAAGMLEGSRMALDLKAEKDYWLGTYEPDLQGAAWRLIQPGMTVFDVGANIGYISLIAARLCGENGKVFAFEALPANLVRLKKNISLNKFAIRIAPIPAAVMDKSGEAVFLAHASGAMGKTKGSAGRDEHYSTEIRVPAIALDDFVYRQGNPAPHLIKMDIEGGEGMALKGMPRLLKEARPVLLIELHGQEAARQVWDSLTENNYCLQKMTKSLPVINSLDTLDWKAYVVAIPE